MESQHWVVAGAPVQEQDENQSWAVAGVLEQEQDENQSGRAFRFARGEPVLEPAPTREQREIQASPAM